MDRTDNSINYIFRPEETLGMLMGNKLWALYRYACLVIVP